MVGHFGHLRQHVKSIFCFEKSVVAKTSVRLYIFEMQPFEAANAPFLDKARCGTLPIIDKLTSIPGYPQKLVIFMTNASRFWQVRCYFVPTTVIRSLRTTNKRDAIRLAKLFYDSELVKRSDLIMQRSTVRTAQYDIEAASELLLRKDQARVVRGGSHNTLKLNSKRDLSASFFRFLKVLISRTSIAARSRSFSNFSLNRTLNRQLLRPIWLCCARHSQRLNNGGWIDRLPTFPQVKTQANPRGHFTVGEYLMLLRVAKRLRLDYQEPQGQGTHSSQHQGWYLHRHLRRSVGVRVADWIYDQQLRSARGCQGHTAQACGDRARRAVLPAATLARNQTPFSANSYHACRGAYPRAAA